MAFGITPEGFVRKRLEDIKLEVEEDLKAELGDNINLLPQELLGQLTGIISERESLIWEQMEAVYNSQYPENSEGVNLDNVSDITGTLRKKATKSQIIGQLLFGTPGTIIPLGSFVSVLGVPTSRFATLVDVTLVTGTDEIQDIGFSATPTSGFFKISFGGIDSTLIAFDDTAAEVQTILEAMSSIGVDNVTVTGSITLATGLTINFLTDTALGLGKRDVPLLTIPAADNTLDDGGPVVVTPVETTKGVPQGSINAEGENTGAVVANSTTLSVIDSPVAGWAATGNPLDAIVGTAAETNAEFKISRRESVASAGAATPNAIFADVNATEDVTATVVFFNKTDIIDPEGRPPHSVDIIVENGDEDEIAKEIFDTVGGGITFVGDISKTVKDDQGFDQIIKFSRPTPIDIHLEIDLVVNTDLFPADGTTQVENAIKAYGDALGIGITVVVFGSDPNLSCSFQDIPGITDFTIRVGTAVSPTLDDNVPILAREISSWDTSRITVVVP